MATKTTTKKTAAKKKSPEMAAIEKRVAELEERNRRLMEKVRFLERYR